MTMPVPSLIIDIGLNPVLVHLGPLAVRWYGLMYVVGILVGLRIAVPYAEGLGISQERVYAVFWPVLLASLVGGRLFYVVQSDFGWYLRHPANILATWEGGMAFYGAVFLGVPAAYIACRRAGTSFPRLLDATAVFIPVAQAFGRVGNLINGDVVGYASALPWAVRYTNPNNNFVASHTIAYQPAAAYELGFSLLLFFVIWQLRGRFSVPGALFALWLVVYAAGQFFLFFLRSSPVLFLGLKQAQLTSCAVIVIVFALAWIWRRHDREEPRQGADERSSGAASMPGL
ncbi:MAG: prolipoprotein diacylglyceryl transferase [Chloroflexota bacterium]